jgi:hypothetical protein
MSTRSKAAPKRGDASPSATEGNARAAVEARTGRPFSDAEWENNRARLLEFGTILRAWDQKSRDATELGNV